MPRQVIEGAHKRSPLNMKTGSALRARIEDSARQSGRSLTAEVEYLVERALDAKDQTDEHQAILEELRAIRQCTDTLASKAE